MPEALNFFMVFLFGLLSRKIIRGAGQRGAEYLIPVCASGRRPAPQIGGILKSGHIRPVIDKVFPFAKAKDALGYLAKGRAKGKVVVQMR